MPPLPLPRQLHPLPLPDHPHLLLPLPLLPPEPHPVFRALIRPSRARYSDGEEEGDGRIGVKGEFVGSREGLEGGDLGLVGGRGEGDVEVVELELGVEVSEEGEAG